MYKLKKVRKKIIITGGAGLIGSFLTDLLVQDDNDVTVIDDFSTGKISHLDKVKNKINIIKGNLESKDFCFNAIKSCDEFYHLASRAYGIGYSVNNQLDLLIHNEKITNNLLDVLKLIQPKKILVVSSSCVYDEKGSQISEKNSLFDGSPESANLGYGWAKRFLEKKFQLLSEEIRIPLYIVRPFNIYGERYKWRGDASQAIPMIIKKVLDGQDPIVLWGTGSQKRSYVHALDCARLIQKLMQSKFKNQPLDIGGYSKTSIIELINLILSTYNLERKLTFDHSKPEGSLNKVTNYDQVSNVFPDFEFSVSLTDGIKKMRKWYECTF